MKELAEIKRIWEEEYEIPYEMVTRLIAEVGRLQGENDAWVTRIEAITSIIGDAQGLLPEDGKALMSNYEKLRADLAQVTAERDELKADAVRFNMHLEQKDRALAANAKYCGELKSEFRRSTVALVEADAELCILAADLIAAQSRIAEAEDRGNQWEQTATTLLNRAESAEGEVERLKGAMEQIALGQFTAQGCKDIAANAVRP